MTIRKFLKQNHALTKEIIRIDYHMDLLNVDLDIFKKYFSITALMDTSGLVDFIHYIYDRCNYTKPDYDKELDEDMTRLGIGTSITCAGRTPYEGREVDDDDEDVIELHGRRL